MVILIKSLINTWTRHEVIDRLQFEEVISDHLILLSAIKVLQI
jgi:hypothetical protein